MENKAIFQLEVVVEVEVEVGAWQQWTVISNCKAASRGDVWCVLVKSGKFWGYVVSLSELPSVLVKYVWCVQMKYGVFW